MDTRIKIIVGAAYLMHEAVKQAEELCNQFGRDQPSVIHGITPTATHSMIERRDETMNEWCTYTLLIVYTPLQAL